VSKAFVFVSCGQYTEAEKSLGKAIVKMVESVASLDAFFAEEVQDLAGLDSSILGALRDCAALITVMHPRGKIVRPDGSELVRASVWIEQEIAIATYIQRVEKRRLPVIAFVHKSVGREGIRDLLHLNPIPFSDESEVLAALPARLREWKGLTGGNTPDADAARTAVRSLIEATKDLRDAAWSSYKLHTHTQPGVTWPGIGVLTGGVHHRVDFALADDRPRKYCLARFARGGPAKRENCDQFVPNWNSIGIPVTTPITKLTPKILAQKRAAWL